MKSFLLFVWLAYILYTVTGSDLELAKFENCQIVGGAQLTFQVSWTYNETHIKMQMDANTPGWLAIGISTDGSMDSAAQGSDIILGFVNDGVGHVADYWTLSTTLPSLDQLQDVKYISGTEENGRTKISFIRKLNTSDPNDRPIKIGESTFLIWAVHPEDPSNIPATLFSRHSKRGNTPFHWTSSSTCDVVPPVLAPSIEEGTVPLNWKSDDNTFGFSWKLEKDTIRFHLEANINGWVGIGFSESPNMLNSDMVVGWMNSTGSQYYFDMWSGLERVEPLCDTLIGGSSDINLNALYYDANTQKTIFQFERPLRTSDIRDLDFVDRDIYVLWAYGDVSGEYGNHISKHSHSGILSVNFFKNVTNTATEDYHVVRSFDRTIHGVLQVITWMGLVPCGNLVAHFFWKKTWEKNWGFVHVALQIMAVVTSTLAVVMMCFLHGISLGLHQVIGFCLLGGIQVQALLCLISKCVEIENLPIKSIYQWLGGLLFSLGVANLALGLLKYGFYHQGETTPYPMGVFVLYWSWLGLVAVGWGYLSYRQITQKRNRVNQLIKSEPTDEDSVFDNQLFPDIILKAGKSNDSDEDTDIPLEDNTEDSSAYPSPPPSKKSTLSHSPVMQAGLLGLVCFLILILIVTFLFLTPVDTEIPPFKYCPDCLDNTYRYDKFEVPVGWHGDTVTPSTTYACRGFVFDNSKQYHIVEFVPIIDSDLVHHMIVFTLPWDASGSYFPCLNMPDSSYPLFIWGAGGEQSNIPYNTGIKIGKNTGIQYIVLQIHYNNPALKRGVLDSSGFQIKMTTKLRDYDVGFLILGTYLDMELPPGMKEYEISGNCTSEWTESLPFPINIFSSTIHAHKLGRAIWTEVWRDGQFFDWIGETALVYDYNKQSPSLLPGIVVVRPGDDFITHCIYDTSKQKNITTGGLATENEMCLNIVSYYPKLDASTCLSPSLVVDMKSPNYRKPKSRQYPSLE